MRTLELSESATYYFDAVEADRAIRFAEKFCNKTDTGAELVLLDWQRWIIRSLFGWKRRSDNLRRFRELYLLTSKGSGKTPLLTMIALFLMLSGQHGVQVISCASNFKQANELSFGDAKRFIEQNKQLKRVCEPQQYQIKAARDCKWHVVSGKPSGRSGFRPTCILADEIHEWESWTFQSFSILAANLFKRPESLLLVATNAGSSRTGEAFKLHQRAEAVLAGDLQDDTLLPVICEAPIELDWTSEAAAKEANPSLGHFVTWEQYQPALNAAKNDPAKEIEYRRLRLSQWQQTAKKWLQLPLFDSCVKPFDVKSLKNAVLYVGLDLSLVDDLCAVAYCYCHDEGIAVEVAFWMPRPTAERYDLTEGTSYLEGASNGLITLLDEPTVSTKALKGIAKQIVERSKGTKVKAVCYDPYRADDCVATLEAAGLPCLATKQQWSLTPGCAELDKRLVEHTIQFMPNELLRQQVDLAEVTYDRKGNYWPVKPNAKGEYAGKRGCKIDGIVAVVNALTEARRHSFPKKVSNAKAYVI